MDPTCSPRTRSNIVVVAVKVYGSATNKRSCYQDLKQKRKHSAAVEKTSTVLRGKKNMGRIITPRAARRSQFRYVSKIYWRKCSISMVAGQFPGGLQWKKTSTAPYIPQWQKWIYARKICIKKSEMAVFGTQPRKHRAKCTVKINFRPDCVFDEISGLRTGTAQMYCMLSQPTTEKKTPTQMTFFQSLDPNRNGEVLTVGWVLHVGPTYMAH